MIGTAQRKKRRKKSQFVVAHATNQVRGDECVSVAASAPDDRSCSAAGRAIAVAPGPQVTTYDSTVIARHAERCMANKSSNHLLKRLTRQAAGQAAVGGERLLPTQYWCRSPRSVQTCLPALQPLPRTRALLSMAPRVPKHESTIPSFPPPSAQLAPAFPRPPARRVSLLRVCACGLAWRIRSSSCGCHWSTGQTPQGPP